MDYVIYLITLESLLGKELVVYHRKRNKPKNKAIINSRKNKNYTIKATQMQKYLPYH